MGYEIAIRRTLRRAQILLLVLSLLASLMLAQAPATSAQQEQLRWSLVAGLPLTVGLNDVFLLDEQTAWVAGQQQGEGVVYRLDLRAGRWEASFEAAFPAPLHAIVAPGKDRLWVVGDQGLIAHKDADGWRVQANPVPGADLRALQMFGAGEEGWAGGFLPARPEAGEHNPQVVLLHYQGGQWRQEPSVSGYGAIEALHFTAGAGWAVGDDVWRYQAGAWHKEPEPFACGENYSCPHTLSAVRAINGDEAWAMGSRHAICAACSTRPLAFQRQAGSWRLLLVPHGSDNPQSAGAIEGLSFSQDGLGLAVGWYHRGIVESVQGHWDTRTRPLMLRFSGGQWRVEQLPIELGALKAISMLDSAHALAVGGNGLILAYGYGAQPQPAARVADPRLAGVLFFEQVGHTLRGTFRGYWERNGGLPVFGYPLSEEFRELNSDTDQPYTVQYFERQRFEHHPQHAGTPYEVLLGRLGAEALQRQGRSWAAEPKADPSAPHYFAETGHAIAPQFSDYWASHGLELGDPGVSFRESLALFGYPITEPQLEFNSSGDQVLTQWFERARFEYHPDNPAPYKVLLGRLAAELQAQRGW